jgi:vacuolar-type H+-ATPase subunit E/Vma4
VSAWSLVAGGDEVVRDRERARDEAQQTVRERLEELAARVADEADARIASAVVPVAGSIVDAGEDILDASEEAIEDMVEEMPGGSLVGQAVDLVLLPGRWSLRVMTTALKGSSNSE